MIIVKLLTVKICRRIYFLSFTLAEKNSLLESQLFFYTMNEELAPIDTPKFVFCHRENKYI